MVIRVHVFASVIYRSVSCASKCHVDAMHLITVRALFHEEVSSFRDVYVKILLSAI